MYVPAHPCTEKAQAERMRAKVTGQGEHETQQRRVCGLEIQMTHQHRLLKKSKMQNTLKMQAGQKRKKKLRRNEQILKAERKQDH